jgi:mRNA interferase RelE/StbE
MAKMEFSVIVSPEAVKELRALPAYDQAQVRDAIERHLRHGPNRLSKSRIKRLRGVSRPQFRLRGGNIRVFYDVSEETVEILAIVTKEQAQSWLEREV